MSRNPPSPDQEKPRMTFHVVRLTKLWNSRARWGIFRELDGWLSGVKHLEPVPGEQHHFNPGRAHARALELWKEAP